MKNLLNFCLSLVGGLLIYQVLVFILIILLSKFINLPSGTTYMLYLSSLPLYGIALWLVITLGPWIFFSFLLYKFFKRTILK